MKYIKKYLEENGAIPLTIDNINNIDCAIFSVLSYIDFKGIIEDSKITMNEALTKFFFFTERKDFIKSGIFQKDVYDLVIELIDKKRYKDLLVSDYVYKLSTNEQFGALTIHLSTRDKIISFEGTDDNLVSWEEDLAFANMSLAPADEDAIKYLNNAIKLLDKNIILVGHSKGGRLAVTSTTNISRLKQAKIKNIYSFDGPGLLIEDTQKKEYQRIKNKIKHIIPNYSIVGGFLYHDIEDIVVKSIYFDIRSHSVFSWVIENNDFQRTKLSSLSIKFKKSMEKWLSLYSIDERKAIFRQIFNTFRDLGYKSLTEVLTVKNVFNIILKTRNYDDDTKKILKNFFAFTVKNLIK